MKNLIILLLIIVAQLTSCSPQKRLQRLIRKHPELLKVTDTIKFTDTIHFQTERVFRDSIFLINDAKRDTVIIKENNLTIRTFINGDTIYVSGECDTIFKTIIKEYKIPYKMVEHNKSYWGYVIGFIILILFTIGAYKLEKYLKKKSRF